ncbi:MAG: EscU/YscU/HrcU family type III secretion system export apparatus switch protein [bacterium]
MDQIRNIKGPQTHGKPPLSNPNIEKAVAFKIEDDQAKVTAVGIGSFAQMIKEEASKLSVPIYKNPQLAEKMINFEINSYVPPEVYDLIVSFINFVSYVETQVHTKKRSD